MRIMRSHCYAGVAATLLLLAATVLPGRSFECIFGFGGSRPPLRDSSRVSARVAGRLSRRDSSARMIAWR